MRSTGVKHSYPIGLLEGCLPDWIRQGPAPTGADKIATARLMCQMLVHRRADLEGKGG